MAKTAEEIVSIMVLGHASVDRHLAQAARQGEKMVRAAEEGLKLGMIADGVAAKQYIWTLRAAVGAISAAAKAYADAHPTGTQHAKAAGVDLGHVTEAGGIKLPQPDIGVMGGGR